MTCVIRVIETELETPTLASLAKAVDEVALQFDVLPFDVDTADHYGALAALVRASGRNPRPRRMDLQIAATLADAR